MIFVTFVATSDQVLSDENTKIDRPRMKGKRIQQHQQQRRNVEIFEVESVSDCVSEIEMCIHLLTFECLSTDLDFKIGVNALKGAMESNQIQSLFNVEH